MTDQGSRFRPVGWNALKLALSEPPSLGLCCVRPITEREVPRAYSGGASALGLPRTDDSRLGFAAGVGAEDGGAESDLAGEPFDGEAR